LHVLRYSNIFLNPCLDNEFSTIKVKLYRFLNQGFSVLHLYIPHVHLVGIYDKEFEMENISIGSLIGEKKIEKIDGFNGDGKKTQFKLKIVH
jgi:hypothetical protein